MSKLNYSPVIVLALLVSLTPPHASATSLVSGLVVAQTSVNPTAFPFPETVPQGTTVRIDGSSSMAVINAGLAKNFEQETGATVGLSVDGTDQALQKLINGDIDLASIGRSLTVDEKAQGFAEYPLTREKIAIIVGPDNPFAGNITFDQFAQIFRGEISDWSELGGQAGPIRFIDRPDNSDTRLAFQNYKVFEGQPFETGISTTQVAEDDTEAVIRQLGNDGIGYGIYSQVRDLPESVLKIVPMHQTLPDNPAYPFSQPRGYIYYKQPGAAAQYFLGYAASEQGKAALDEAVEQEVGANAAAFGVTVPGLLPADAATNPDTASTGSPTGAASEPTPAELAAAPNASDGTAPDSTAAPADGAGAGAAGASPWWWLLLPLGAGGGLLWWNKSRSGADSAGSTASASSVESTDTGGSAGGGAGSPPTVSSIPEANIPATAVPATAAPASVPTASVPATEASTTEAPAAAALKAEDDAIAGAVPLAGVAAIAAVGAAAMAGDRQSGAPSDAQSDVEAAKFNVGQTDLSSETLADVDDGLPDLPGGYGESRIVLLPRDPQIAYAYWDVPNDHREELRRQGGQTLALRFYDITDVDLSYQNPHSIQQYDIDETARDWYVPVPVSDRDYIAEIGYLAADGRWLMLARSAPIHVPPVYPSDWFEENFITVDWDSDLRGQTLLNLVAPGRRVSFDNQIYDEIFGLARSAEALRLAGSLYGSMQHVAGSIHGSVHMTESLSSYVFPSGVGLWSLPTVSGLTMSGAGLGFSGALPIERPRKFWLVADAELIVYGATEADATVTIGDRVIPLSPDGTFRFQIHFPDGFVDYPIKAVAVDGEQTRSIHMEFNRETPERNTNTKDEATDEWFS